MSEGDKGDGQAACGHWLEQWHGDDVAHGALYLISDHAELQIGAIGLIRAVETLDFQIRDKGITSKGDVKEREYFETCIAKLRERCEALGELLVREGLKL